MLKGLAVPVVPKPLVRYFLLPLAILICDVSTGTWADIQRSKFNFEVQLPHSQSSLAFLTQDWKFSLMKYTQFCEEI
jgi:hypothetical protein